MDLREDIILPLTIAASYFATVYFLVSELTTPTIGVIVALVVMVLALLWLLRLKQIGMTEYGLPIVFLAIVFPLAILLCGIMAWIVRLLVG